MKYNLSQTLLPLSALTLLKYCTAQDELESKNTHVKACREKDTLLTKNDTDFFKLVEVPINFQLKLLCRFCKEPDDEQPKNWYRLESFNESRKTEVAVDMNNDISLNRVQVNPRHTLIINNVTQSDSGQYLCHGLEGQETDYQFKFLVAIVFEEEVRPDTGNLTLWENYQKETLQPLNFLFSTSDGTEYHYLRNTLQLHVEIITDWEEFGPCEVCGRPMNDGIKRKTGHCRLKMTSIQNHSLQDVNDMEIMLLKSPEVPCRSMILAELVEGISNVTRLIPDFIVVEHCEGTCNPDAEGVYRGWKSSKKTGFKFRKTMVLAENSHITIICPESTLENRVVWKRKGKALKPGIGLLAENGGPEPRVHVDTFNTLYLYDVTHEEEGNYTCFVDDIRMQQVIVFVVSKSRLLTQAFVRHMMYLAFVLSLTLSCYCAGLVVTWTRRHRFKSYEDLKTENIPASHMPDTIYIQK